VASVTKQDLIKRVVAKTGKTSRDVTDVVGTTLDAIREALAAGDDVRLINFGVFSAKTTAARAGVNPKTREKMQVPEKTRVKFAPGKELNAAVAKPAPAAKPSGRK
jgi:DNA-binding protein HU-beta